MFGNVLFFGLKISDNMKRTFLLEISDTRIATKIANHNFECILLDAIVSTAIILAVQVALHLVA